MTENFIKKINKTNLYFLFFLALLIPFIEFINHNIEAIEPFLFRTLFFIFIIILVICLSISALFSFFLKIKFINSLYLASIISLIIFSYDKLKSILYFFLKNSDYKFFGEFSVILIAFFAFSILISYKKNYKSLFRFINFYIVLTMVFSFSTFIYKIDINLIQNKNNKKIYSENLFDQKEISNIKKNKNNRNIYYLIFDAAIPLEDYSKNYQNLNVDKEINFWKKNGFEYLNNIKSSYDATHLTISQMFNMNYLITEESERYTSYNTFPTTMTNFYETAVGKTLKKINYEFFWIGNAMQNCRYYLVSSCLKNVDGYGNNLKSMVTNLATYLNSNYVSVNFLQKTPLIDLGNKIFENYRSDFSATENAWYENDGAKKFFEYSNKLKSINKNYFVFVHAIMPHGFSVSYDKPNVYNEDCSKGTISKKKALESLGDNIKSKLSGELIGYKSNYLCFMMRVKQFINFINDFDPEGIVIITSDHGINIGNLSNNIFFLSKVNEKCRENLTSEIDQINAMRLAITCATDQKISLIKKRSFIRTKEDLRKLKEIYLN